MAAKSTFVSNIGTPTGKTVTLSTCSYEFDNARYVVIGELEPINRIMSKKRSAAGTSFFSVVCAWGYAYCSSGQHCVRG